MARPLAAALLGTLLALAACRETGVADADALPAAAYAPYVTGFTGGAIGAHSDIRVEFAERPSDTSSVTAAALFGFDPYVAGRARWVDAYTLAYRPDEPLEAGADYTVTFALRQVRPDVPDSLANLRWGFRVVEQGIVLAGARLRPDPVAPADPARQQVVGTLRTLDFAAPAAVEESLSATQSGRDLAVAWSHEANGRLHGFVVEGVRRGAEASAVRLRWRGAPLGVDGLDSTRVIPVPSRTTFALTGVELEEGTDQVVTIYFSDPLDPEQDLTGLLYLDDGTDLRLEPQGNAVLAYPARRLTGSVRLTVAGSLRNAAGGTLGEAASRAVRFTELKPAVAFADPDGVIVPSSLGAVFPFRAVGLHAVYVEIVKVYTANVAQFLQDNDLAGRRRLSRVGRPVFAGDVPLRGEGPVDYLDWNLFALDLGALVAVEPGALYHVRVDFAPRHSAYPCPGAQPRAAATGAPTLAEVARDYDAPEEFGYYDYYDGDYGGDYYRGEGADDPCADDYYRQRRIARNFVASDIGLVAKGGDAGEFLVVATDITTAQPLVGVDVELLDAQRQRLAFAKTGGTGVAAFAPARPPALVVARRGDERAYLNVERGEALSTSSFAVGGERTPEGVRGVIYGERGVWRPGDSIYLTLALERPGATALAPATPAAEAPVVFELRDPNGRLVEERVVVPAAGNFYDLRTATPSDAPTGPWRATVRAGAATVSRAVRIETVMPNRLKVELALGGGDGGDRTGDATADGAPVPISGSQQVRLSARWLHGAPAGPLKADVRYSVSPATEAPFSGGSPLLRGEVGDYSWRDGSREFAVRDQEVFEGTLGADGTAEFSLGIADLTRLPGLVRARFTTRVFEQTGAFSTVTQSATLSPFASYVGVRAPTPGDYYGLARDRPHDFHVVVVDATGRPVPRDSLLVEVYNVDWRYWWERTGGGAFASYVANRARYLAQEHTVAARRGEATFTADFGDLGFGRKLLRVVDPASGHAATVAFYLADPRWAYDAASRPGGSGLLAFDLDADAYEVGGTARVGLPAFPGGRALVSVENGSRVLSYQWVTGTDAPQAVEIATTPAMAPNAYVHVTLLQPHAQTANDQPIRLYGIQPLRVTDPARRLSPKLTLPAELAPEEPFAVEVRETDGRAMTYTVAVVEEGLLDITSFATPDLYARFNRDAALGVRTWDVYRHVLGAFADRLSGLLAVGGDEDTGEEADPRASRFRPVVKFAGPFTLAPGASATHRFEMPNYVGSVRAMVVAGHGGAYGSDEATAPVKRPLMALATLPRVLGPGEAVELPVTVFAMDPAIREVDVRLARLDLLEAEGGRTRQTLRFDDGPGERIARFRVSAPERLGVARVRVEVSGAGFRGSDEVELDVRAPNPEVTEVAVAAVEPGETWRPDFVAPGMLGTNTAALEVSGALPVNLTRRLGYLTGYPHGCLEQVTSRAFPQLYLGALTDLDPARAARVQANVNAALARLDRYRIRGGGYSYWPGRRDRAAWSTSYVGHFLVEAQRAGYAVAPEVIADWTRWQRTEANAWTPKRTNTHRDELPATQAYRLFTLALAGKPQLGAMNRLRGEASLDATALYLLAAAYHLAGQRDAAREQVRRAEGAKASDTWAYRHYTYGSRLRDRALALYVYELLGGYDAAALRYAEEVSAALSSQAWHSTQGTAWGLLAMAAYYEGAGDPDAPLAYRYSLADGSAASPAGGVVQRGATSAIALPAPDRVAQTLTFENTGTRRAYARLVTAGTPSTTQSRDAASNLAMSVEYTDLGGRPLDPQRLPQGQDFLARVTVRHPGRLPDYTDLALTQIFPSGWEIRNRRLEGAPDLNPGLDYEDIRDDRVLSYFDLAAGKSQTVLVTLNAAYPGRFYLPDRVCEAMYDNEVSARRAGGWVTVAPATPAE